MYISVEIKKVNYPQLSKKSSKFNFRYVESSGDDPWAYCCYNKDTMAKPAGIAQEEEI